MNTRVLHGDCVDELRQLPEASVHAVVTDPPYGLSNTDPTRVVEALTRWAAGERDFVPSGRGFMDKSWDAFVPPPAVWDECLRVLKPGGHLLAFAGSRTFDLMTLSIRFAGFDIRDGIAWLYGSGFPKSLDVSKAVDKLDAADVRRARALEFTAWMRSTGITARRVDELTGTAMGGHYLTAESQPAVATAELFDRLRPELPEVPERIEALVLQRTVESANYAARQVTGTHDRAAAAQVWKQSNGLTADTSTGKERRDVAHSAEAAAWQGWGTALKPAFEPVVVARKALTGTVAATVLAHGTGALNIDATRVATGDVLTGSGSAPLKHQGANSRPFHKTAEPLGVHQHAAGRWPTNVVLDGPAAAALDAQTGTLTSGVLAAHHARAPKRTTGIYGDMDAAEGERGYGDSGGASRFFPTFRYQGKAATAERPSYEREDGTRVAHPTVKPVDLMRWLVRLVTPPRGHVLDPFAGSGATVEAALAEGFDVTAIEREADYLPLIEQRIERARRSPWQGPDLFDLLATS